MINYLILSGAPGLENYSFAEGSFIVGVDRGGLEAIKAGIKLDLAYGDFDSVDEEEFHLIEKGSKKVIKLDPVKDVTDTEGAVDYLTGQGKIVILGGIKGKRVEHFIANLILLSRHPNVVMEDENSLLMTLLPREDSYVFSSCQYKYFSFFSFEQSSLTLQGFKYPLDSYVLKRDDPLGISNELEDQEGRVIVKGGRILAVLSKDDH
ncbi:MAG: thiamine diphosphokinase [Bacilli bacterium]|jgi:thiamine pyrophosphokinase|nr:thiamine diphosphokinase [Bacilli bacterium]